MARPLPPKTLFGGWLTRYQHVERLGNQECDGILNGEVIVQEKLDGANLTICRDPETGSVVVCTRNQVVLGPECEKDFQGAAEYAKSNAAINHLLHSEEGRWWILRGEWLVRHSIAYPTDVQRKFYLFDVEQWNVDQDGESMSYLHPDVWQPVARSHGILIAPEVCRVLNPTVEQLGEMATGDSLLAPGVPREGVVIKNYSFVNCFGRTAWGKLVCSDFKAKHRAVFGATRNDTWDERFAALATPEFVLKTIHSIEDALERRLVISDMPRVLETVWRDLVTEEIYNFSKKHRGLVIDFNKAKRATGIAARETALAYFNGQFAEGAA